jgi:RNA polymerase sigma-70 factor (ECF subfamily)
VGGQILQFQQIDCKQWGMTKAFLPQMEQTADAATSLDVPLPVFEEFFATNRDGLYAAMWLVTRHRQESEEIVQDAFLKVWERWDRVGGMDDPTGYLYRTAMNVWRSRGRRAQVVLRRAVHALPPDPQIETLEERDVVIRALAPLTPRQRAALVLTDLLGLTSEEAGAAMRVRSSTVRVLAARGRATLKERMQP